MNANVPNITQNNGQTEFDRFQDHYPTRRASDPAVLARSEPVAYGSAHVGPLDQLALNQYAESGFIHFDHFFNSNELNMFLKELNSIRTNQSIKSQAGSIFEPNSQEIRSIFAVHNKSEIMHSLCYHPRLVLIAQQLLGSEVYLHQTRINYKAGFRGQEFYWHSDFETWHAEDGMPRMRAVSCSISLTENTHHNGPLMLIPGSHLSFVSCVGETPENNFKSSLRKQDVGVPDDGSLQKLIEHRGIISTTGPAGSVTFFECNMMHGSNSNITPQPRSNVFVVYNSVRNRLVAPFCGLPARPDFVAHR
jgi:ectoine hydroxylase